jgi:hypothetical protein
MHPVQHFISCDSSITGFVSTTNVGAHGSKCPSWKTEVLIAGDGELPCSSILVITVIEACLVRRGGS